MINFDKLKGLPTGTVEAVMIGIQEGNFMTTEVKKVQVTREGFTGDHHAGLTRPADSRVSFFEKDTPIFNDRQVTIVSVEELAEIASRLEIPEIKPQWIGANLLLRGIPNLSRLIPSTRLLFPGGVSLYVTRFNNPCLLAGNGVQAYYPEIKGIATAFPKQATHLRGVVAIVELPGEIRTGDTVIVRHEDRYAYLSG